MPMDRRHSQPPAIIRHYRSKATTTRISSAVRSKGTLLAYLTIPGARPLHQRCARPHLLRSALVPLFSIRTRRRLSRPVVLSASKPQARPAPPPPSRRRPARGPALWNQRERCGPMQDIVMIDYSEDICAPDAVFGGAAPVRTQRRTQIAHRRVLPPTYGLAGI
ncbi:hypothetical protein OH77DRAFT_74047 [Trametes cingulata]|nr:hypothetical protein OH77DRAFT_74047 [Trametes cingulata]